MTSSNVVSYLLSTHLQYPPEASLTVLTNILNATTNWLLLRYLLVANEQIRTNESLPSAAPVVVFVSFLRDWEFWKDNARRLGLDLVQAVKSGKLIYIDGLTALFARSTKTTAAISALHSLGNSDLAAIDSKISDVLASASKVDGRRPLCIIDGLDFLLASTETSSSRVLDVLMSWRNSSYAMILAVSADKPLVHSQQTPLDIEHAAFVMALLYQAYLAISLRLLTTGAARDVSGVLNISRAGSEDEAAGIRVEEKELLYLVNGDGSVKVFERGA